MGRSRETINATVLATAIRIDAGFETDIRTLVACDNGFRAVPKKLRRTLRPRLVSGIDIDNIDIGKIDMQLFEAVGRAPRGAATVDRLDTLRRLPDKGPEFFLRSHGISSHEHIRLSSEFSAS